MEFRPTLAQLKKDVRCINRTVFKNELNLKEVVLEIDYDLRAEWGYCVPGEEPGFNTDVVYIGVADKFPDRMTYDVVLTHEMIHLYQLQILKIQPTHGASFKKLAKMYRVKV